MAGLCGESEQQLEASQEMGQDTVAKKQVLCILAGKNSRMHQKESDRPGEEQLPRRTQTLRNSLLLK